MRTMTLLLAAGALLIPTASTLAHPGQGGGPASAARVPSPTTAPGNGQFNGHGYSHMNSGQAKGQPNQSCETTGTTPGNSASAPGGGSPFAGDSSNAGSHYAGSQLQNSRNTASVSQYDVACANQPR